MKLITADQAAALIQDGWTVCSSGGGMAGYPEAIAVAAEKRFLNEGAPRDLTLLFACAQGDRNGRGPDHFIHDGMLKRIICGHMGASRQVGVMAYQDKIEAYLWPQGVIAQLYRAIAGGRPGVVSQIGLHSYVDPRQDGGRVSDRTREELVELVTLKGQEWLFFPSIPINCALVRGTTADSNGNISVEEEACLDDFLTIAQAARNSGGIVIAQVKRLSDAGTLPPRMVRVPGILVDYVVVAEPEHHWQTSVDEVYNPAYTGEVREPEQAFIPLPMSVTKVIQRRAFLELLRLNTSMVNPVVNLGVGMPMGIADVAREEEAAGFTMTVETGPIGGRPSSKVFGPAINPEAIVTHAEQFDFYDGGGLDICYVGFAEADRDGNVNVSRFGGRVVGLGGFQNITQTTPNVVFCGSFNARGFEAEIENGGITIVKEGEVGKFVAEVEHLSFNAKYVESQGVNITYVTERAVFAMRGGQLTLIEVAPGIDVRRDILDQLPFSPAVADPLPVMDSRIFNDGPMGIVHAAAMS